MITETQWNQALRNTAVHQLARQASMLLQGREMPASFSGVLDWALKMALGEQRVSIAEYYAAGLLVLTPEILERVSRKAQRQRPAGRPATPSVTPEKLRRRWQLRHHRMQGVAQYPGTQASYLGKFRAYESIMAFVSQAPWDASTLPGMHERLLALIEQEEREVGAQREQSALIRKTHQPPNDALRQLAFARGRRRELRRLLKELEEVIDTPQK